MFLLFWVLHQFLFWSYQKNVVPLQRILKSFLRMKKRKNKCLVLWSLILLFTCTACDHPNDVLPSPPIVDVESLDFYVSSSMNGVEQHRVFKDTITPPSNPMYEVPYIPGTYTFRGVLQLEYFFGQLFCVVRTANNDYFMIDDGINYLFRLDNPQLKNCVVGDTIMVCAVPMKLLPTDAKSEYSLATYYVYPKIASSDNNK